MRTNLRFLVAALAAAALVIACGDDDTTTPADTADTGTSEDAGTDTADAMGTDAVADVPVEEVCYYPSPVGFARGLAFPDYSWEAVYADGTPVTFDLYDFFCDDEAWGQYETVLFLITTDWCPNCPAYIQWIDALSDQLEENGMLVFYLDVQNSSGGTAYTDGANQHIGNYTPNGSGIRAGDGNNLIQIDGVLNSGLVEYFPTSFVVRRDDMSLIADQRDTSYYLPLVEIAMDPTADWSSPPEPGIVPEFPANCEDADEEEFEPNNTVDEAGGISGTTTIEGGVCDSQPDYYDITIEGDWQATLEFTHALGDLDMYIWDVEAQGPMQGEDGSAIGSDSTTDNEEFTYSGPAKLFIYGFRGATAPYTLTITEL